MAFDKALLAERMRRYFDPGVDIAELRARNVGPVRNMARFDSATARVDLLQAGRLLGSRYPLPSATPV